MTDGDVCPTNREWRCGVFPLYQEGIKGCVIIIKVVGFLSFKTQPNLMFRNFNVATSHLIPLIKGDNHLSPAGGGEGGGVFLALLWGVGI